MFLRRLKAAAVLLALGAGASSLTLHLLAAVQDDKEQRISAPQVVPDQKSAAAKPKAAYRLTGSVRVEGTGQPIAGAKLQMIQLQKYPELSSLELQTGPIPWTETSTGTDGEFSFEALPGTGGVRLLFPPRGYLIAKPSSGFDLQFGFGPDNRVIRKDFLLRPGTVWKFRLSNTTKSSSSYDVDWLRGSGYAEFDGEGLAHQTLPSDGGKFSISIGKFQDDPYGRLRMTLEAAAGFRPDSLQEISRDPNARCGFRMIDTAGRTATLQAPGFLEAVNEQGKLVIRIDLPDLDHWDVGEIVGQVVDDGGRPIEGARINLLTVGAAHWRGERGRWTTDAEGRYDLLSVPRRLLDGTVPKQIVEATKEGFCGAFRSASFDLRAAGKLLSLEPIRLYTGVESRGDVVDHRGKPVVGASVVAHCLSLYASGADRVFTDDKGCFVCRDVRAGPARVSVGFGQLQVRHLCLADGSPTEVRIQLPGESEELVPRNGRGAVLPQPLNIGQPAPEWLFATLSDGRLRTLAEQRNRGVVLYFWDITDPRSVSYLPVLAELRSEFERHGVFFLAIHGPGQDDNLIRRVLEFKRAPLLWAVDFDRQANTSKDVGATAWRYGFQSAPLVVGIDKEGKVAFRYDRQGWSPQPPFVDEKRSRGGPDRRGMEQTVQERARVADSENS